MAICLVGNTVISASNKFRYFPKFSDGQAWANSADTDQTAHRGLRGAV